MKVVYVSAISIILFYSCQSQTPQSLPADTIASTQELPATEPNYNYQVEAPENWEVVDTVMPDGIHMKMIRAPWTLVADSPYVNIIIAYMEGWDINEFTIRNINYLKLHMPGATILEKGNIDSTVYNGKWFTYSKVQNERARDMINYIIPLNGFAYSITCGTSKGKMNKYRSVFDKIAKSFKG